jgi:hypothetical protein
MRPAPTTRCIRRDHAGSVFAVLEGTHAIGYAERGRGARRWSLATANGIALVADAADLTEAVAVLAAHETWRLERRR